MGEEGEGDGEGGEDDWGSGADPPPFVLLAIPVMLVLLAGCCLSPMRNPFPPAFRWEQVAVAKGSSVRAGRRKREFDDDPPAHGSSTDGGSGDDGGGVDGEKGSEEKEDQVEEIRWTGTQLHELPSDGPVAGCARVLLLLALAGMWWGMSGWVLVRDAPIRVPLAACDERVHPQWRVSGEWDESAGALGEDQCRTFVGVLARRWVMEVPRGVAWVYAHWSILYESISEGLQDEAGAEAKHLQELGLEEGASWGEIKKAYRRLARELHPDTAGRGRARGAGEGEGESKEDRLARFHRVRHAFEELQVLRGKGGGHGRGGDAGAGEAGGGASGSGRGRRQQGASQPRGRGGGSRGRASRGSGMGRGGGKHGNEL